MEGGYDLSRDWGCGGVKGSSRHRMTAGESPKGEGPVYKPPCSHSPFNKPGLMSVCLSYIVLYIDIDIHILFLSFQQHLGKYSTKFNTRNIVYND